MNERRVKSPRPWEGNHQWKRLYDSKIWKDLRATHLAKKPLCAWHKKQGRLVIGNTVHHKIPHRGDWSLFNDPANLETLCSSCHSGAAQQQEAKGYATTIGEDGWPVDAKHPMNKT